MPRISSITLRLELIYSESNSHQIPFEVAFRFIAYFVFKALVLKEETLLSFYLYNSLCLFIKVV